MLATTQDLMDLPPGNYTVTVKNAGGCIASTPAVITPVPGAPTTPVVTLIQPTCTLSTGTITVTNVTAGAPDAYTYTIRVCNSGPSCAQNVVLLDHFPIAVLQKANSIRIVPENGTIEFALATPAKGQSNIALVYTAKAKPLDPVSGELALELPRTSLFIERFDWSVSLPAAFEITTFYGAGWTANRAAEPAREQNSVALRKEFCRGERPAAALFYQRLGLEK